MTKIAPFVADFPGAFVVPADQSNAYNPANHGGVPNRPRAWVLHTPEEPADNNEVTPYYFQTPGLEASTHYYLDNDGDVYQMVPETWAAIANGRKGKPPQPWEDTRTSLNWQTVNVEIEGYGATIHQTMTQAQFDALVRLIKHRAAHYGIPLDRTHIIGHYQVADDRSDPGALFPWDRLMAALQPQEEDEDMPYRVWCPEEQRTYLIGPQGARAIVDPAEDKQLEKDLGPHKAAYSRTTLRKIGIVG